MLVCCFGILGLPCDIVSIWYSNLVNIEVARAFLRDNHRCVMGTIRKDGGVQLSPVLVVMRDDSSILISSRETAIKTKNLRRSPRAFLCVFRDSFFGQWVQLEGQVDIQSLPDAMHGLVEYYRLASGEHPDWDEYRRAMINEKRVLITMTPDRIGPTVSG